MTTIYHVTRDWDGGDLLSLAGRMDAGFLDLDEGLALVAEKWFGGDFHMAERYLDDDGREVHCHATLAEAIDFRDEWCDGGIILEIDASELEILEGREYPHPVIRGDVPASLIRVVDRIEAHS